MNLSVRSNVNTYSTGIGDRIRRDPNMSLRNVFASRGREPSLRLEDLSDPVGSSGLHKKPQQDAKQEHQDAGLAAAMSIARLFVSSDSSYRRKRCSEDATVPKDVDEEGSSPASPEEEDGEIAPLDEKRLQAVLDKVNQMRAEHDERLRREILRNEELERENAALRQRLRTAAEDVDDRHTMAEYARLIVEQMPGKEDDGTVVADSQYVLKLQSQLCRALHKMGVLTNQIELAEGQERDKVRTLQSQLVEQGNESFRAEVEHMNDLLEMEKEMESLKEDYESENSMQQGAIAKMEVELELERSMRCDAMSYVGIKDEQRKERRRARRRRQEKAAEQKKKRLSKRGSEMSDATAVMANISDEQLYQDQDIGNDEEMFLSFNQTFELEEPLKGNSGVSSEEEDNVISSDEVKKTTLPIPDSVNVGDQDVSRLRMRLEESLRTIEELKSTVSEQNQTIKRLALDHNERPQGE